MDALAKLANRETTVLKAKNNLSELLHKVERGEEVFIRRGAHGPRFQILVSEPPPKRSLEPNPEWAEQIRYQEEDVWASEWKDEV